ncbi:ABC transporter permease subunit [candidate division KSB3 bacterium]|jgi:multiple sugar transport system permease protein|uniref:ABC transporter permease subunit n=1 Tax=candidate division KSB3 bacterium TaxID=2044937 RepID=A0A9D5JW22_9BACT|nr:ABC transporter permease subunit [candidate division KSB3 bacterium]MBD3325195.1 ABC transporter permease subunit [candidate division KSB3 bacterium]
MARINTHRLVMHVIIGIILLIAVLPIAWMIISSFKSRVDIISYPPKFLFTPVWENYARILEIDAISISLKNSLIIVPISVLLGFLFGVPTAYIFARIPFRGKADLRFFVLSLRFMPPVAVVIPFFMIWLRAGLLDSIPALVITYLTISISTMIWLTIECFKRVPIECEEIAQLEGCTQFQVFYKIALPIALPSLLGMSIFIFILIWNEFFLAFVLTSHHAITMPVASASFAIMGMEVPWGQICASITLLSIPPLILSYFFVKFLPYFFKVH